MRGGGDGAMHQMQAAFIWQHDLQDNEAAGVRG